MKKITTALLLIFGFLAVNAQTQVSTAAEQGFDEAKLNKIHEHIENNIKTGSIPGAVVLVARNNKIVYYEATGYANMESGKMLTKDVIFRLASMSKPITGVAVLMLTDQGKIGLNDPLSKYLPEYKNMRVAIVNEKTTVQDYKPDPNNPAGKGSPSTKYHTVPANREVTIKDLLTHSSGIAQGIVGFTEVTKLSHTNNEVLADYVPKWAKLPLDFQPGSLTGYSPLAGFEILGRVVEVVSGEPLDQFLSKYLFKPLDMKNTGFLNMKGVRKKLPVLYQRNAGKGLTRDADQMPKFIDSVYFSGAGGMLGTMEDYYHFAQMLANGGTYKGKRILSPEIVKQMSSPQLADTVKGFPDGQTWGLSVRVITKDNGSAAPLPKGCFGWSGAYGTHFWIDPANKIVALYMTNVSNIGGAGANTARELERDVIEALKK